MAEAPFPTVEGNYQMTKDWSVFLPQKFKRRFEDDQLVLWRPGFTLWIAVWGNDKDQSAEERLARVKRDMSKEGFDLEEKREGALLRFAYRLKEDAPDKRVPAYYCFAIGRSGHVQMAIYFDDEATLSQARAICWSVAEVKAEAR